MADSDEFELEKIPTGIEGLDKMLEGGLIKGRPYVLCGRPGAGKTIFCMQFLRKGVERGENSMYVTLEEPVSEIQQNIKVLGWDIDKICH